MLNLDFVFSLFTYKGRRFAEQELYILLSKLVEKYRIEYVGEPFEPILHTVMVPDRPVAFKFVPRG